MRSHLISKWRDKLWLIPVAVALTGTISWTPLNGSNLKVARTARETLRHRAGQPTTPTTAVPQSITLLEDTVTGGSKIHGVVRIVSRVSGDNAVKLHTDKPGVLKPLSGSSWPALLSIPSGTEVSFEIETNTVTVPTEVRLFACQSSLPDGSCTDETANALATVTVMPAGSGGTPIGPGGGTSTPYHVQPIPITISSSGKVILGSVVDFDVTTHLIIKVPATPTDTTETVPVTSTTPSTSTATAEGTASPVPSGSGRNRVVRAVPEKTYEVDTDTRSLLISPKAGGVWPVSMKFEGVYNSLLHIKTRSPQQAGINGPAYVKIFARKPGAPKTSIVTVLVQ